MQQIIMATTKSNGDDFARARGWTDYMIIKPGQQDRARGYVAPVYATPEVRRHPTYPTMLDVVRPCGLLVDHGRVA